MELSEGIEEYRDVLWRRSESTRIRTAEEAEALVNDLGFCLGLTDSRTDLPSLYIAVCGRRDVQSPRNVQKDEETSLAWVIKDEVMRRGKVFYSKLAKSRATFVARELVPFFHSIYRIPKSEEGQKLSPDANRVLGVLRTEWESSTADLRTDSGITDRKRLTKALNDLQKCMKVVPYEVIYKPRFTYLWTLAEERYPKEIAKEVTREAAVRELARVFLRALGMTRRADLAKALGIPRWEAGAANQALVEEGVASRIGIGVYCLRKLESRIQ